MDPPFTLPFDTFWNWLMTHPHCILRAGTPETALYDDEDFHWHFATEAGSTLLVQVLRGKRLIGELLIDPEHITYVQGVASEREEEHIFELIAEGESDRVAGYFFVLVHGYEDEVPFTPARVH